MRQHYEEDHILEALFRAKKLLEVTTLSEKLKQNHVTG